MRSFFAFFVLIKLNIALLAQDTSMLSEIQTFDLNGKLKSILINKYNDFGSLLKSSDFDTNDNFLEVEENDYDSINRITRSVLMYNGDVIRSSTFQFASDGQKIETRLIDDDPFGMNYRKTIIEYDLNNSPVRETEFKLTRFKNGDSLQYQTWDIKKFYDSQQRVIIDSTFNSGYASPPPIIGPDGKIVERKKLNTAIVTNYKYEGDMLVSWTKVDEYGGLQIERTICDNKGQKIRFEQLGVFNGDTNGIITNYSYQIKKGMKIRTEESVSDHHFFKSRTYFKKGIEVKHESLDENDQIMSQTVYCYNEDGSLKEQTFSYFMDQRPINNLSNHSMGERTVYFYQKVNVTSGRTK